jgi:hypothetical protein
MPFARWLIGRMEPKIFVELGTHTGNSYFSFCQGVQEEGLSTKCFAVDTWKGDAQAGLYDESVLKLVEQNNQTNYSKFSTLYRMTFDEALGRFQDRSVDLLHIDGLHTYEAVRHDFETWLPKLSPGGLVLFHDIKIKERNFGVWKFWSELKKQYPRCLEFEHSAGLGILQLPGGDKRFEPTWLESGSKSRDMLVKVMKAAAEAMMKKIRKDFVRATKRKKRLTSNRIGFGKRLEQSIRERRKWLQAQIGFDRNWYLREYNDVAESGMNPKQHYLRFGMTEDRFKSARDKKLKTKEKSRKESKALKSNPRQQRHASNATLIPTEVELKEFGYTFLGPALTLLFQEINNSLLKTTIPTFIAREGFALKNIYLKLAQEDLLKHKPAPLYLSVSRQILYKRILLLPELNEIIWKRIRQKTTLKDFLIYKCRIDESFLNQKIPMHILKSSYNLPHELKKLNKTLSSIYKELSMLIEEDNETIDSYLKTLDLSKNGRSPIFIDIGYSATVQKIISSILNMTSKGIYLISTERQKVNVDNNDIEIIGALRNNVEFDSGYTPLARSLLMEALLTTNTGQVVKILKTPNGQYEFIYGEKTINQSLFHLCKAIQSGAEQCVIDCFKKNLVWEKHEVERILSINLQRKLIPKSLCHLFEIEDMFQSKKVLNSYEIFT